MTVLVVVPVCFAHGRHSEAYKKWLKKQKAVKVVKQAGGRDR